MTDAELVVRKLAFIESCISELKRLAQPEKLRTDIKEERYVTHTLQIAIQAALDAASHIVSAERLGEPSTNRELFMLLDEAGWIIEPVTSTLYNASGFRNVVVHGYDEVDVEVLEDILQNRTDDLLQFCAQVRSRLQLRN